VTLTLSYVVVTDTFATIRDVVRAVAAQTIHDQIELVIVCSSAEELALDPKASEGIGAVRVIEAGPVIPLSPPRAIGVRAATCPLVFVGETHSYPAPDCMERLMTALASEEYAAVMPMIVNGNPDTALSWASIMLTYRHWMEPTARAGIDVLSTYNACFRRQLLLDFGDELTELFDYGSGLDQRLRRNGARFLIEPAARLSHLNVATFNGFVPDRFLGGRFWGSARMRPWPVTRRLLYLAGAPLIPALIAGKALRSRQWIHHRPRLPRGTALLLLIGAILTAAGEVAAYAAGRGKTPIQLAEYELHRSRYI